jgi:hypothetical protein
LVLWLADYAQNIERYLVKGQSVYRLVTTFDEAIDPLFLKLREHLSSPFATDLMRGEGTE